VHERDVGLPIAIEITEGSALASPVCYLGEVERD